MSRQSRAEQGLRRSLRLFGSDPSSSGDQNSCQRKRPSPPPLPIPTAPLPYVLGHDLMGGGLFKGLGGGRRGPQYFAAEYATTVRPFLEEAHRIYRTRKCF